MLTGSRRLALAIAISICAVGCGNKAADNAASTTTGSDKPASDTHKPKLTKLEFKDVKVGTGDPAADGDQLIMKYTGKLADGTVFDSNDKEGGQPFPLILGSGNVIKGWDQGLVGMKEGGERELSIPAQLGYGDKPMGDKIPPNSDLYFDVKLDSLIRQADKDTVTYKDIKAGTGPVAKDGDSVTITYTMSLPGQDPIDSTDERGGHPMTIVVGGTAIFKSVSMVLDGMKKGGERKATIPSLLGPHGPDITPGSPTVWDIKVLDVRKKS